MRQKTQAAAKSRKKRQQMPAVGSASHNHAAALSPAQQLGSLGGAARARNLTAEQRREIAQKAAAKRWERLDQAPPPAAGPDHAAALIERNRLLLSQAADVRLRSVTARSKRASYGQR
jgi:hypothetical protein